MPLPAVFCWLAVLSEAGPSASDQGLTKLVAGTVESICMLHVGLGNFTDLEDTGAAARMDRTSAEP